MFLFFKYLKKHLNSYLKTNFESNELTNSEKFHIQECERDLEFENIYIMYYPIDNIDNIRYETDFGINIKEKFIELKKQDKKDPKALKNLKNHYYNKHKLEKNYISASLSINNIITFNIKTPQDKIFKKVYDLRDSLGYHKDEPLFFAFNDTIDDTYEEYYIKKLEKLNETPQID